MVSIKWRGHLLFSWVDLGTCAWLKRWDALNLVMRTQVHLMDKMERMPLWLCSCWYLASRSFTLFYPFLLSLSGLQWLLNLPCIISAALGHVLAFGNIRWSLLLSCTIPVQWISSCSSEGSMDCLFNVSLLRRDWLRDVLNESAFLGWSSSAGFLTVAERTSERYDLGHRSRILEKCQISNGLGSTSLSCPCIHAAWGSKWHVITRARMAPHHPFILSALNLELQPPLQTSY